MKSVDVAAKLDSVKGHKCNRKSTIIVKYYGDKKGLPLGFGIDELCEKLNEKGVTYKMVCANDKDIILYIDGEEKKGEDLNVSASTSPRTPTTGTWDKVKEGDHDVYYWKPEGSDVPGYPKDNTQCWDDILELKDKNSSRKKQKNDTITKLNKYRKEKGLAPLPTKKPFKGFPFTGTPPDLNVDLKDYVYGTPITLDIYSSDRTFNFYVAEEMYSAKDNPQKYTSTEVRKYMEDNKLTWHESEDGRTLMKVPTVIHQNIPHKGGVNAIKREGKDVYTSTRKQGMNNAGNSAEEYE